MNVLMSKDSRKTGFEESATSFMVGYAGFCLSRDCMNWESKTLGAWTQTTGLAEWLRVFADGGFCWCLVC